MILERRCSYQTPTLQVEAEVKGLQRSQAEQFSMGDPSVAAWF